MLEIVLDTNLLVAAFRSKRGASYQLVRSIGQGDWRLDISVALALEYEDVLKRKDILPGGITDPEIDRFLDYLFSAPTLFHSCSASGRVCLTRTMSVFWKRRCSARQ
jgi:predicted nucleic acid-binding protein